MILIIAALILVSWGFEGAKLISPLPSVSETRQRREVDGAELSPL